MLTSKWFMKDILIFLNKGHIKTVHEGQNEHKCETCGKEFGHLHNLQTHIKNVHEVRKDHECETCAKMWNMWEKIWTFISKNSQVAKRYNGHNIFFMLFFNFNL